MVTVTFLIICNFKTHFNTAVKKSRVSLQTYSSGVCDVGKTVGFLHFGVDVVKGITSDSPCWNYRMLSSCCLGTERLGGGKGVRVYLHVICSCL